MSTEAVGSAVTLVRRRAWLLMLLDVSERSGLAPLRGGDVHRIAFFANCLAPVYDVSAADAEILKYRRGPFYPDVQWDLDRLVVQGFVHLIEPEYVLDEYGAWRTAKYELTVDGIEGSSYVRRTPASSRMYDFLRETAGAYASLQRHQQEAAPFKDATFGDPRVLPQSLLDLSIESKNYSVRTANAFAAITPMGLRLTSRERLHLYFRYLDRMVSRVAG